MTYVGRGIDAISNVEKLDNITFDGSTTYNLTKSSVAFTPSGKNNILVSINGVVQQGNFTVAGATIVFDFSPTSNDTCNFIMHYGTGVLNVPADDTVKTATVQDDAITTDKLANSINSAITANTAKTTNATHSGEVTGATALTIADNIVDEANLKVSNSAVNGYMLTAQSGNTGGLTWASVGGDNTPQFLARSSSQSISNTSHTAVINPSEMYDSDSLYNTSDGKFTVTASTTGYYFMIGGVGFSQSSGSRMQASFYKNGSITHGFKTESYASSSYPGLIVSGLFNLSSDGDYVQLYCYQNTGSSKNLSGETEKNFFGGFKLIT